MTSDHSLKNNGRHLSDRTRNKRDQKPGAGRELLEWCIALVSALAVGLLLHFFVFQFVQVQGPSMQPTLYTGERLLCTPATYMFRSPVRGEIVITSYPNRGNDHFVKRVIALPGETISVHSGRVWIDGKSLDEPYIPEEILYEMDAMKIPEGYVFVMGDNRNDSSDSHSPQVGPLKISMLKGKAHFVVWPFSKMTRIQTPDYH